MALSLSQIRVSATSTMSSFALEEYSSREEYTDHVNPWFYSSGETEIEELLDGSLFRSDFAKVSALLSSFSPFWTSVIEIEVLNEKDCSLHAVLRVPPKTDLPCILQRF